MYTPSPRFNTLTANLFEPTKTFEEQLISIAIEIGAPSTMTTAGKVMVPYVYFVEASGRPQAGKEVTISTSPCNFSNPEFIAATQIENASAGRFEIFINDPSRITTAPKPMAPMGHFIESAKKGKQFFFGLDFSEIVFQVNITKYLTDPSG